MTAPRIPAVDRALERWRSGVETIDEARSSMVAEIFAEAFPDRFVVFAGPQHYPSGGVLDRHSAHPDADTALAAARALTDPETNTLAIIDWWHVDDSHTGRVIALYDIPIPDAEHVGDEQEPREVGPHAFVQPDKTAGLPDWAIRCQHCGHQDTFPIHDGDA